MINWEERLSHELQARDNKKRQARRLSKASKIKTPTKDRLASRKTVNESLVFARWPLGNFPEMIGRLSSTYRS